MRQPTNRGFIALVSVLIISVVLLGAVISLAQYGLAGRFLLLDIESKQQSERLAQACVQVAVIAVVNDPLTNRGYTTVPVGSGTCAVVSIMPNTPASGQSRVRVTASSTSAYTNLETVVTASTGALVSLEEKASF